MYISVQLTKLECALAYAKLGWAVFPCHTREAGGKCSCGNAACKDIAKHPVTANGVKDATKDAETLARYFGGEYAIANIAVATGEPSGCWVLDVDDPDALAVLERQYGALPKTPTVETGGGGRHFYFRWTRALANLKNSVKFAGNLDVRTTGGYVLVPPSAHASGKEYRWLVSPDETPIADAPDWLIALIPKRETLTISAGLGIDDRVTKFLEACPPAISGQRGHDQTFGIVCRLLEVFPELRERSDDAILLILDSWNARCVPPWTDSALLHKIAGARAKAIASITAPAATVKADGNGSDGDGDDDGSTAEEWPTLHADALCGFAGNFVRYIEPYSEADNVGLLLTFLNAFGNCVGRNAFFPAAGVQHFGNIYICVVGASSRSRKGTSLGYVSSVFAGLDVVWSERRVNGLSSGEGVINAVRDPDVHADGGTFNVGGGVNDKRIWIVETEFGNVLKMLQRNGNTLSGVLRDAWDNGELSVLTRHQPLRASGVHASIVGHITIDELRRYLNDVDVFNGFANRFLWTLCRRSKLLPDGNTPSLIEWRQRLTKIVQRAKTIGEMKRSPSASALWNNKYASLVAEKRGQWDAATSRAEAQTLRLSMLYALLDGSATIEEKHLRAALAVWRYCDDSARLIFTADNDSEGGRLEAKIRQLVRERPGIMRTELRDSISHKIKASELEAALTWLAGRGEIERKTSIENGRRCERLFPVTVSAASASTEAVIPDAPTPQRPVAPDAGDGAEQGTDRGTMALTSVEFVGGITQTAAASEIETATATTAAVATATLAELVDWKNANGATFVRRVDGVWVTNEERLTPEVTAAIHANQETLATLVPADDVDYNGEDTNEEYSTAVTPSEPLSEDEIRLRVLQASDREVGERWASEPCIVGGKISHERFRVGIHDGYGVHVHWLDEVEGRDGITRWLEAHGLITPRTATPVPAKAPAPVKTTPTQVEEMSEAEFFAGIASM
jgi:hypothetical protein